MDGVLPIEGAPLLPPKILGVLPSVEAPPKMEAPVGAPPPNIDDMPPVLAVDALDDPPKMLAPVVAAGVVELPPKMLELVFAPPNIPEAPPELDAPKVGGAACPKKPPPAEPSLPELATPNRDVDVDPEVGAVPPKIPPPPPPPKRPPPLLLLLLPPPKTPPWPPELAASPPKRPPPELPLLLDGVAPNRPPWLAAA
jgi:hypothetical protein